jgi:hypothetical protein
MNLFDFISHYSFFLTVKYRFAELFNFIEILNIKNFFLPFISEYDNYKFLPSESFHNQFIEIYYHMGFFSIIIVISLHDLLKNVHKNNLINFLYQKINNNKKFKLWSNSKRNIIDIDDAVKLCFNFIKNIKNFKKINLQVNIANTIFFSVINIVNTIEKLTLKKAIYDKKALGNLHWKIKPLVSKRIIQMSSVSFNKYYLEKVLRKYYILK